MSVPFRASGPFDLLRVIPAMFDFVPEDAVVVAAINGGYVAMAGRLDLAMPEDVAEQQCAAVADAVVRANADFVLLVRYCTTITDEAAVGDSIAMHLMGDHIPVMLNVTVTGSQIDGSAVFTVAGDPTVYPAPSASDILTMAGTGHARRRDDVERSIEPGPRADSISALVALRRTQGTPVAPNAATLWERLLTEPVSAMSDDDVADAVHALSDPMLFDRIMLADPVPSPCVEGMRDRLVADASRMERLTELAACLTDAEAAPVLNCLAVTAYANGMGALLNVTEDRLRRTRQPMEPMAFLMLTLAAAGISPTRGMP